MVKALETSIAKLVYKAHILKCVKFKKWRFIRSIVHEQFFLIRWKTII